MLGVVSPTRVEDGGGQGRESNVMTTRIWRLTPVDLSDPAWEASSHDGMVMVRATDEDEARHLAQAAFGVKTRFQPGAGIIAPPWLRAEHVKAEVVLDSPYDPDGPTEVLVPSFEHDLDTHRRKKP